MAKQHSTPGRRATKDKRYIRTLKVRKGYYVRTVKDKHHAAFDKTVYSTVPWINLQGQWLERAGFSIHTPVTIRVMEGCLVVTVERGQTG